MVGTSATILLTTRDADNRPNLLLSTPLTIPLRTSSISRTSYAVLCSYGIDKNGSMPVLRNAVIIVAIVSSITFIALFGQLPAFRKTPVGWLQRVLCIHIPSSLRSVDQRLTGGRTTEQSRHAVNYLFYQKNPVVLVGEP